MSDHEKLIYDLVVPLLERRSNEKIVLIDRPDKSERNSKAIDFVARGKEIFYLIEHTFIENQIGRKQNDAHFKKLLEPLMNFFYKKFTPGFYYQVYVSMSEIKGAKETAQIQTNLISWVENVEPLLKLDQVLIETPSNIPFAVRICKRAATIPDIDGMFLVGRISHASEESREARIKIAFDDKFPKLNAAKSKQLKARSILILESNDLALSNHILIWKAVEAALQRRADVPDEIYLIEMELENRPVIWILKEAGAYFSQIREHGPHYLKA